MKKVISVLMAVAMLAALMVPAFAATLTQDQNSGGATVKTDTSAVTGDGTYTVTYDAEITVPWNSTDPVSSSYKVDTHLRSGKQLQVTVTGDGVMTYENETLAYSLGGALSYTADAVENNTTNEITVTVAQGAWDEAPIAEYTGTITYTAEII